jgi:serine/threonine protein kinase
MRIQCPNCQAGLEISQPKPGSYRPRCKHCGQPFLIAISDDQPPKIRIGRVKPTPAASTSESSPAKVTNVEATIDSATQSKTRSTMLEETIAPSSGLDQTMDSATGGTAGSIIVSSSKTVSDSKTQTNKTVVQSATVQNKGSDNGAMPARLGGYRLIRMLGRGAMGAVYEAKQVSLDRTVALKTIRDRLVNKPSALARFTREAYAAAQLNHHNVVQIYDFGEDAGQHYFSMERVDGTSLDEVVKEHGAVEARLAATYIAQAARGLQFAHRSGMVHRDVKPANLLLSRDGVVKVADLGLVKVPDLQDVVADGEEASMLSRSGGSQVTMMGTAVGTPAYMAPEQSVDATQVDHRADIYSLGCTLFYLLAGKPPYDAQDVSTLLAQHANAPIPDVRAKHPHIPLQLDRIIHTAMAKRVEDRYATLAEMINDLEEFLGVKSGDSFSPSVASADAWSDIASQFISVAPQSRLRSIAVLSFVGFCGLLFILTLWIGFGWVLMGPICLLSGVIVSALLESTQGESAVGRAARRWIGSLGFVDWIYALALIVLVLGVALFAGCWPGLIAGTMLGVSFACGYHFGLRRPIHNARKPVLEMAEKMLREFRIGGADEDGLRIFAARYSGRSWSELFENLFGFDALLAMRDRASNDAAIKVPSLSLRDRVVMNLNQRAKANHETRDQQKLSKIEQRALVSEGVSEAEARDRAWQMAAALMDATKIPPAEDTVAVAAEAKRQRMKNMMADARSGRYSKSRDRFRWLKMLLGAQLRLALGVALLAVVAMWAQRSGILDREVIQTVATQIQQGDVNLGEVSESLREGAQTVGASEKLKEASIFGIPVGTLAIVGLILVASAFVSGWIMTPFAIAAAATAMFGPAMGVPAIGPVPASVLAVAAAIVLLVPGALISERAAAVS